MGPTFHSNLSLLTVWTEHSLLWWICDILINHLTCQWFLWPFHFGCLFSAFIKRIIYTFLNVCPFDYTSFYIPRKSLGVCRNHKVCLFVRPSVCLSRVKLTLALHNFWKKNPLGYEFNIHHPHDKTFLSVPNLLTLWTWPWLLTYF